MEDGSEINVVARPLLGEATFARREVEDVAAFVTEGFDAPLPAARRLTQAGQLPVALRMCTMHAYSMAHHLLRWLDMNIYHEQVHFHICRCIVVS